MYLSLAQEMVLPQAEPALRAPRGMGQDSEIRVTREETACVFSNAHVKGGTHCPRVLHGFKKQLDKITEGKYTQGY